MHNAVPREGERVRVAVREFAQSEDAGDLEAGAIGSCINPFLWIKHINRLKIKECDHPVAIALDGEVTKCFFRYKGTNGSVDRSEGNRRSIEAEHTLHRGGVGFKLLHLVAHDHADDLSADGADAVMGKIIHIHKLDIVFPSRAYRAGSLDLYRTETEFPVGAEVTAGGTAAVVGTEKLERNANQRNIEVFEGELELSNLHTTAKNDGMTVNGVGSAGWIFSLDAKFVSPVTEHGRIERAEHSRCAWEACRSSSGREGLPVRLGFLASGTGTDLQRIGIDTSAVNRPQNIRRRGHRVTMCGRGDVGDG